MNIECKGLYFRSKTNTYFHNNTYVQKKTLSLLKRLSCKGCCHCTYDKEMIDIAVSDGDYYPNIENGYIYKIYAKNEYDLGFTRVGRYYIERDEDHREIREFS